MRKCFLLGTLCLALVLASGTTGHSQSSVDSLSSQDIVLFIQSYESMLNDLKALSAKYESYKADEDISRANEEAINIFKKHGWDERYMSKYSAIVTAFTYVTLESQLQESPPSVRESMSDLLPRYKRSTNDADVELVRAHYSQLTPLLSESMD